VPLVWSSLLIYEAANGTIHPKCYAVIHKSFVLFREGTAIPYLPPCLLHLGTNSVVLYHIYCPASYCNINYEFFLSVATQRAVNP
jgi:hypothetical protein